MADWADAIASAGTRAATRCDGNAANTPPRRVAICVAGAARSLATKLQLHSLKHHLVQPLAPHFEAGGSRLFFYVKLADSDKVHDWDHGQSGIPVKMATRSVGAAPLLALLNSSWVRPMLQEAVVLNGSGAYTGRGWSGGAGSAVVTSDPKRWRRFRQTAERGACWPPWGRRGTLNDSKGWERDNQEERMLLAALGLQWCREAIERAERDDGHNFSVVAFMRPDLLLPQPVPALCEWPALTSVLACSGGGGDSLWVTPRQHLTPLTSMAEAHAMCKPGDPFAVHLHKSWERRNLRGNLTTSGLEVKFPNMKVKPACCGPPEDLLQHVLRPLPVHDKACARGTHTVILRPTRLCHLSKHDRLSTVRALSMLTAVCAPWSACAATQSCRILSEKITLSILRRVDDGGSHPVGELESKKRHGGPRHVCDVACDGKYADPAWAIAQMRATGLNVAVGYYLRALFNRSTAACKEAMAWYDGH